MARCQLDSPKKNRIVGAVRGGCTYSKAGRLEGVKWQTAAKIYKKFELEGKTSNKPRTGRPPKVTPEVHDLLIAIAKLFRFMPLRQLGNAFQLSKGTVRHQLALENLHRHRARRVIKRTPEQEAMRLAWANQFSGWTLADWMHVVWSDESYVCLDGNVGNLYVTRSPEEEYDPACTIARPAQSNIRVMVWACIGYNFKGPLVVLEFPGGRGGGMTAARYCEQVLEPYLLQTIDMLEHDRGTIFFQQDNAPAHTARVTYEWLEDHGVRRFPHPAVSPDISPIEPTWFDWKNIIRSQPVLPASVDELKAAVRQAWDALTIEQINTQVASLPNRVSAVIFANGGETGY